MSREDRIQTGLADLARGAPHTPDDRQSGNYSGMPAAKVDMGWLQDRVKEIWSSSVANPRELADVIETGISTVVQGVDDVAVTVFPEEAEDNRRYTDIQVKLISRDDYGDYSHRFVVRLWIDEGAEIDLEAVRAMAPR